MNRRLKLWAVQNTLCGEVWAIKDDLLMAFDYIWGLQDLYGFQRDDFRVREYFYQQEEP